MSSSPPNRSQLGDPVTHDLVGCDDEDNRATGAQSLIRVALIGALLGASVLLYACDTVARLSFPSRTLSETHTAGLTLPAGSCADPEAAGNVKLRFTMIDSKNSPIRPPDKGGQPLESGEVDLTVDDISFENSGVFEYPDLPCGGTMTNSAGQSSADAMADSGMIDSGMQDTGGGNGNGNGNGNGSSSPDNSSLARVNYDGECNLNGYTCRSAPGISDPSVPEDEVPRCFNGQDLQLDNQQVEFVSNVEQDQLFGILVENSGSTGGYNPSDMVSYGAYHPHEDAEGNTDTRTANQPGATDGRNTNIATDDESIRKNAVESMVTSWGHAESAAAGDGNDTEFGLWGIQSASSPTSYVASATDSSDVWTSSLDTANNAQEEFDSANTTNIGANIYEALNSVVVNHFDDGNCPGGGSCEKTLVLVVDGPSDVPLQELRPPNSGGITFQTLRQNLVDAGVRLFVVHFDRGYVLPRNAEMDETPVGSNNFVTLDDPGYYSAQAACSDDSDCHHFQTCRKVDGFANSSGEDIVVPENPHDKFCVPVRGDDGRIGPIGLYSRLACATQGSYIYRKSNLPVDTASRWLPYTMDGIWEVSVPVEVFGDEQTGRSGVYTRGQPIKVQTEITYDINTRTQRNSLTQQGNNAGDFDARDTRSVIMTSESNGQ